MRTSIGFGGLDELVIEHDGGIRSSGANSARLLREAGSQNIAVSASCDAFGTPEFTFGFSRYFGGVLNQHRAMILKEQWATESELAEMQHALLAWGSHPDAFYSRCGAKSAGSRPGSCSSAGLRNDRGLCEHVLGIVEVRNPDGLLAFVQRHCHGRAA